MHGAHYNIVDVAEAAGLVLATVVSRRADGTERLARAVFWCAHAVNRLADGLHRTLDGHNTPWAEVQVAYVESLVGGNLAPGGADRLDRLARPLEQVLEVSALWHRTTPVGEVRERRVDGRAVR